MLVVSGPVADGKGHTVAVDGTCNDCDGVKLRNIQVRVQHLRKREGSALKDISD